LHSADAGGVPLRTGYNGYTRSLLDTGAELGTLKEKMLSHYFYALRVLSSIVVRPRWVSPTCHGSAREEFAPYDTLGRPVLNVVNDIGLMQSYSLEDAVAAFSPAFRAPARELLRSAHVDSVRVALEARSARRPPPHTGVSITELASALLIILQGARTKNEGLFEASFGDENDGADVRVPLQVPLNGSGGEFDDSKRDRWWTRFDARSASYDIGIKKLRDSDASIGELLIHMAATSGHLDASFSYLAVHQMREVEGRLLKLIAIHSAVSHHVFTCVQGGGDSDDDVNVTDCSWIGPPAGSELQATKQALADVTPEFVENLELAIVQALGVCQYLQTINTYRQLRFHISLTDYSFDTPDSHHSMARRMLSSYVHDRLLVHTVSVFGSIVSRLPFAERGTSTLRLNKLYDAVLPDPRHPCMTLPIPAAGADGWDDHDADLYGSAGTPVPYAEFMRPPVKTSWSTPLNMDHRGPLDLNPSAMQRVGSHFLSARPVPSPAVAATAGPLAKDGTLSEAGQTLGLQPAKQVRRGKRIQKEPEKEQREQKPTKRL
jgi:hypothetical protein